MIKIAVTGVNGRMGAAIAQEVINSTNLQLTVATVRAGNQLIGTNIANSSVIITDKLSSNDFDVLIDFTLPNGVINNLEFCLQHQKAIVIGATGFDQQQQLLIQQSAKSIPVFQSSNMSLGVNLCFNLLKEMAQKLDSEWQVTIEDVHHIHKKDSPSGTAKTMQRIIQENSHGKDVAINSSRLGETVGEHRVIFTSQYEQIVLEHVAFDRRVFAHGAVVAAEFVYDKQPGLYRQVV